MPHPRDQLAVFFPVGLKLQRELFQSAIENYNLIGQYLNILHIFPLVTELRSVRSGLSRFQAQRGRLQRFTFQ